MVWGLCTGEWSVALGVAIFFELFWLDQIPAGTHIPPNASLGTLLALGLAHGLGLETPGALALPLGLSVALALLGARLESFQRKWQDAGYNDLLRWARRSAQTRSPYRPERLVLRSMAQMLVLHFVLFALTLITLLALLSPLYASLGHATLRAPLSWGQLWFLAALGGVMALRLKKAYALFGIVILALAAWHLV